MAPSNDLRFLPPVPIKSCTEIRDCLTFGNVCPQYGVFDHSQVVGDEDCLFLNVYTPSLKTDKPKAVMFYLHGGGWFTGSGNDDLAGPDLLINNDVIYW